MNLSDKLIETMVIEARLARMQRYYSALRQIERKRDEAVASEMASAQRTIEEIALADGTSKLLTSQSHRPATLSEILSGKIRLAVNSYATVCVPPEIIERLSAISKPYDDAEQKIRDEVAKFGDARSVIRREEMTALCEKYPSLIERAHALANEFGKINLWGIDDSES